MFCQIKNSNLKCDRPLHQGFYSILFRECNDYQTDLDVFIRFRYTSLKGAE